METKTRKGETMTIGNAIAGTLSLGLFAGLMWFVPEAFLATVAIALVVEIIQKARS